MIGRSRKNILTEIYAPSRYLLPLGRQYANALTLFYFPAVQMVWRYFLAD